MTLDTNYTKSKVREFLTTLSERHEFECTVDKLCEAVDGLLPYFYKEESIGNILTQEEFTDIKFHKTGSRQFADYIGLVAQRFVMGDKELQDYQEEGVAVQTGLFITFFLQDVWYFSEFSDNKMAVFCAGFNDSSRWLNLFKPVELLYCVQEAWKAYHKPMQLYATKDRIQKAYESMNPEIEYVHPSGDSTSMSFWEFMKKNRFRYLRDKRFTMYFYNDLQALADSVQRKYANCSSDDLKSELNATLFYANEKIVTETKIYLDYSSSQDLKVNVLNKNDPKINNEQYVKLLSRLYQKYAAVINSINSNDQLIANYLGTSKLYSTIILLRILDDKYQKAKCLFELYGLSNITNPPSHQISNVDNKSQEPLFKYIHISILDEAEKRRIHQIVVNLVTNHPMQSICKTLKDLEKDGLLLLPHANPMNIYNELIRLGMPDKSTDGFAIKTFKKHIL